MSESEVQSNPIQMTKDKPEDVGVVSERNLPPKKRRKMYVPRKTAVIEEESLPAEYSTAEDLSLVSNATPLDCSSSCSSPRLVIASEGCASPLVDSRSESEVENMEIAAMFSLGHTEAQRRHTLSPPESIPKSQTPPYAEQRSPLSLKKALAATPQIDQPLSLETSSIERSDFLKHNDGRASIPRQFMTEKGMPMVPSMDKNGMMIPPHIDQSAVPWQLLCWYLTFSPEDQYFSCNLCGSVVYSMAAMALHLQQEHAVRSNYRCSHCPHVTSSLTAARSHRRHHNNKSQAVRETDPGLHQVACVFLQCGKCGIMSCSLAMMRQHATTHQPPLRYACGHCSFSTDAMPQLATHHYERHPADPFLLRKDGQEADPTAIVKSSEPRVCALVKSAKDAEVMAKNCCHGLQTVWKPRSVVKEIDPTKVDRGLQWKGSPEQVSPSSETGSRRGSNDDSWEVVEKPAVPDDMALMQKAYKESLSPTPNEHKKSLSAKKEVGYAEMPPLIPINTVPEEERSVEFQRQQQRLQMQMLQIQQQQQQLIQMHAQQKLPDVDGMRPVRHHRPKKPFGGPYGPCDSPGLDLTPSSSPVPMVVPKFEPGEKTILAYRCNICEKKYDRLPVLKCHVIRHMDLRPLRCKLCQYTSNDYSDIIRHVRGTHSIEDTPSNFYTKERTKIDYKPYYTTVTCSDSEFSDRRRKKRSSSDENPPMHSPSPFGSPPFQGMSPEEYHGYSKTPEYNNRTHHSIGASGEGAEGPDLTVSPPGDLGKENSAHQSHMKRIADKMMSTGSMSPLTTALNLHQESLHSDSRILKLKAEQAAGASSEYDTGSPGPTTEDESNVDDAAAKGRWLMYECAICHMVLTKRFMCQHMSTHPGVAAYTCPDCKYQSHSKLQMRTHLKKEHNQRRLTNEHPALNLTHYMKPVPTLPPHIDINEL